MYAVVVTFYATVFKFFAPFGVNNYVETIVSQCQNTWWKNLLYISNIYPEGSEVVSARRSWECRKFKRPFLNSWNDACCVVVDAAAAVTVLLLLLLLLLPLLILLLLLLLLLGGIMKSVKILANNVSHLSSALTSAWATLGTCLLRCRCSGAPLSSSSPCGT